MPIDDRGVRLAKDIRRAIEHREHDRDLHAAIRDFDSALAGGDDETLQDAASSLLVADTVAERRYRLEVGEATARIFAPELLEGDSGSEAA